MPYIDKFVRKQLDSLIEPLSKQIFEKGELNYIITQLLHDWIIRQQRQNQGKISYEILSNSVSVLQDAGDEFKRTILAKYEDRKRRENGPISELDALTLEDVR